MRDADSAQSLLRDVCEADIAEKEGPIRRGGPFQRKSRTSEGSQSKQYAKMGLVMDSPTKSSCHPQTLSNHVTVCAVKGDAGGGNALQASPPMHVQDEPVQNNTVHVREEEEGDGVLSSPDSGYGNTSDQPVASEHLLKVQPLHLPVCRPRSGAIRGSQGLSVRQSDAREVSLKDSSDSWMHEGRVDNGVKQETNDSVAGALELDRRRGDTQDSTVSLDVFHNRDAHSNSMQLPVEVTFPLYNSMTISNQEATKMSSLEVTTRLPHRPHRHSTPSKSFASTLSTFSLSTSHSKKKYQTYSSKLLSHSTGEIVLTVHLFFTRITLHVVFLQYF